MSIGFIFWLLMILWFFSFIGAVFNSAQFPWAGHASTALLFALLFLLGWHDFGFVIHA